MTEKRFTLTDDVGMLDVACGNIYDDGDFIGTVQLCDGDKFVDLLNEQHETIQRLKQNIDELMKIDVEEDLLKENEKLKKELQRIYDVATLKKARDIVDKIYDDLLYETSEKSDYARNKVLECLEKLDEFGDGLE